MKENNKNIDLHNLTRTTTLEGQQLEPHITVNIMKVLVLKRGDS